MKVLLTFCALVLILIGMLYFLTTMPGKSYSGPFLPLTLTENENKRLLQEHIEYLGKRIGPRHVGKPEALAQSAQYIKETLSQLGYTPSTQSFNVDNVICENIIAEIKGQKNPDEIIIIGAHYDSALPNSFGANDNGSGVAAILVLAKHFASLKTDKTLRFVLFVNEEAPFFYTDNMGSLRYAKEIKKRKENIKAMFCLETIGFYSENAHSQYYPFPLSWFYPNKGNFIGFISNISSRPVAVEAIKVFRETTNFPSEGASLPSFIQGVGFSDHWSFWQEGYPAIMITDTAFYRYPFYHTNADTPDKVDYERLARVVSGIEKVIAHFVKS